MHFLDFLHKYYAIILYFRTQQLTIVIKANIYHFSFSLEFSFKNLNAFPSTKLYFSCVLSTIIYDHELFGIPTASHFKQLFLFLFFYSFSCNCNFSFICFLFIFEEKNPDQDQSIMKMCEDIYIYLFRHLI